MISRYAPLAVAVLMSVMVAIPFLKSDGGQSSLTGAQVGGHFTLESLGGSVSTDALKTDLFAVYFGYTFCPDVCPTELARMTAVLDGLGEDAKVITPFFVTVDPARDNVIVVDEYAKVFHPRMVGLSGTDLQIETVKKQYQVYARKVGDGDGYLVDHSSRIYLLNSSAQLLALFSMDTSVDTMIEQIQNFL